VRRKQVSSTRYGEYRSGLEFRIANQLDGQGVEFEYEQRKVWFIQPAKLSHYTPDFILPNGVIVEGKGRFLTDDRQKHKHIRALHSALDVRFVFSRSAAPINKGSKTTYAMWCEKYGFQYADKLVPQTWLDEPICPDRWLAIAAAQDKLQVEKLLPNGKT